MFNINNNNLPVNSWLSGVNSERSYPELSNSSWVELEIHKSNLNVWQLNYPLNSTEPSNQLTLAGINYRETKALNNWRDASSTRTWEDLLESCQKSGFQCGTEWIPKKRKYRTAFECESSDGAAKIWRTFAVETLSGTNEPYQDQEEWGEDEGDEQMCAGFPGWLLENYSPDTQALIRDWTENEPAGASGEEFDSTEQQRDPQRIECSEEQYEEDYLEDI